MREDFEGAFSKHRSDFSQIIKRGLESLDTYYRQSVLAQSLSQSGLFSGGTCIRTGHTRRRLLLNWKNCRLLLPTPRPRRRKRSFISLAIGS